MKNENKNLPWSKLAIWAFISSFTWIYGIGSLLAIILGIVSIRKINRSNKLKGKGLAIAGIILGGIGLILPLWILTSVIWTIIARV
ncbi:MAG: DUF4190 domain-containing protein [Candidatus Ratteibacteria bacterium]|nr:DUF4190 domain-containing protein [Candidatus Ratteibacteria bacterium]